MNHNRHWAVLVILRRPTRWQAESEALYGPLTADEMQVLARSLPQHNVHRVVAYPLRPVPTDIAGMAVRQLRSDMLHEDDDVEAVAS